MKYLIRVKVGGVRVEDEVGKDLNKEMLEGVLYEGMYKVSLVV